MRSSLTRVLLLSQADGGTIGRPPTARAATSARIRAHWTTPDASCHDPRYGTVKVTAWHDLHPEADGRGRWRDGDEPPIVQWQRIRVEVEHLPKPPRTDQEDPVAVVVRRGRARPRPLLAGLPPPVRHRAHLPVREGDVGMDDTIAAEPEQADRWTRIVIAAYTQLRLARQLVDDSDCHGNRGVDPES